MPPALPRLLMIVPWFGRWPDWTALFLASCRANPTIDWVLPTDCGPVPDLPPNVRLIETSLSDYLEAAGRRLGVSLPWRDAYKVCDLRPAYGVVHADLIAPYDNWGYGDIDVIYGDLRAFLTPDVLAHTLVSSHDHIVAGHFAVLRNTPAMRHAFERVFGWKRLLADPRHRSFDEQHFSSLFLPRRQLPWRRRLLNPHVAGALFVERYSTAIPPLRFADGGLSHPTLWTWSDGHLTNERTGPREFMYVHFSHWNSGRWTGGARAPWAELSALVRLPEGSPPRRFTIGADGFGP